MVAERCRDSSDRSHAPATRGWARTLTARGHDSLFGWILEGQLGLVWPARAPHGPHRLTGEEGGAAPTTSTLAGRGGRTWTY
jgi:hypothetical protein